MEYRNDDARVLEIHERNYLREYAEGVWKMNDRDIPRKPYNLYRAHNTDGTPMQEVIGCCPSCNRYTGFSAYEYCQYCGQRFDWSDADLCVATPIPEVIE